MTMPDATDPQVQATHVLSPTFKAALLQGGSLNPILDAIQRDATLLLGIRSGNISIYYRGGELLKITEAMKGCFAARFNHMYHEHTELPEPLKCIASEGKLNWRISISAQAKDVVSVFHELKRIMDPRVRRLTR